jgi:membrane fusion protein, multidrug efflux system
MSTEISASPITSQSGATDLRRLLQRRRALLVLALVVALSLAMTFAWWYLLARHIESTDDAYVGGDVVQITSEVAGTVVAISADDTQRVQSDQQLLALDPADANVAMRRAEADLASAVRSVRTLFAQSAQQRAQIDERAAALQRARDDYNRRTALLHKGAISGEEVAHMKDGLLQAQASLAAAREERQATLTKIDGTGVATHPQVEAAAAAVRYAALMQQRTQITAPLAGIVARRSVQLGQHIAAGTPLMAVVPLDNVWVDANFKEVQLQHMRIGQPVTLHSDLYGDEVVYHGKLAGVAAGSGSIFSLLPAQNASGNWIKIVQRVPVRITLDAAELKAHPLRLGLSMNVSVDVADTQGNRLADAESTNATIAHTLRDKPMQLGRSDDAGIDARIAKIIDDNSGGAAALFAQSVQP